MSECGMLEKISKFGHIKTKFTFLCLQVTPTLSMSKKSASCVSCLMNKNKIKNRSNNLVVFNIFPSFL